MPIILSDYKRVAKNIKINKKNIREFLFDFRVNGKRYRKVNILVERAGWNKADYTREAQVMFAEYRNRIELKRGDLTITDKTKLNDVWDIYFKTLDQNKRWTKEKKRFYTRVISPFLGKKAIGSIQEHQIQDLIRQLKDGGGVKQRVRQAQYLTY
ncbi:MAG: hypothetical protein LBF13_04225 [Campylobacteraceae bacterium]|jgi:hypothetical protein|nr:hypothetical protein [Campylobacteraceae bacterium]